jgi:hypothetical protein
LEKLCNGGIAIVVIKIVHEDGCMAGNGMGTRMGIKYVHYETSLRIGTETSRRYKIIIISLYSYPFHSVVIIIEVVVGI